MRRNSIFGALTTEKRLRRLELIAAVAVAGWLVAGCCLGWLYFGSRQADAQAAAPASLRVSELVVVDPKGVERVRIGGDLPDAIINGKRMVRGEKAAGVLLYDGSGQERSGYVTFEPSSNVALTLDTKKEQVVLFAAGPESGSTLQMWSGADKMDFRVDSDGARYTLTKGGVLAQQQPELERLSPSTCDAYKDVRKRFTKERAVQSCRQRFLDKACQACLSAN